MVFFLYLRIHEKIAIYTKWADVLIPLEGSVRLELNRLAVGVNFRVEVCQKRNYQT